MLLQAQQAQMIQQQHPQQQQPNGIGRPSGTGLLAPQSVLQIRSQVNISQQQRLPNNMGPGNPRLSPQQMLQAQAAQAAQARAIQVAAAQAQAQAQAVQNAAATLNGMGPSMNNSHLSPPYNNRATTSSPIPRSAVTQRDPNSGRKNLSQMGSQACAMISGEQAGLREEQS